MEQCEISLTQFNDSLYSIIFNPMFSILNNIIFKLKTHTFNSTVYFMYNEIQNEVTG